MAEPPVSTPPAPVADAISLPGANFLRGVLGMPLTRQFLLLAALAASVAIGSTAVLWMRSPDYQPLTDIANAYQAQEVTNVLDGAGIAYRIDHNSGMLLVRREQLYQARMRLAGAAVMDDRQLGYELLDREQSFGVSQMMETVAHRRSLEGELAKSIATISAVRSARVLLAQPRQTAFVRDRRNATASVTINVASNRSLSRDQITGIANLVAGAVPSLAPEDVAVVDQTGKLLSSDVNDPDATRSARQLDYTARLEESLRRKLNNILAPTLGMTGFSAEVAVDVDFNRVEQTREFYDPEQTAVRSEAAMKEEAVGVDDLAAGIPGALSNDPALTEDDLVGDAADLQRRSRSEVTKNYEVDRTISHTQQAVGVVRRVSVSVVVDDKPVPVVDDTAIEGAAVAQGWTDAELERLAALVRDAVGFSEARGDSVTIVNRAFVAMPVVEAADLPIWQQPWVMDFGRQLLIGLALLVLVFGLLRPAFKSLSQAGAAVREQQTMALARLAQEHGTEVAGGGSTAALAAPGVAGLLPSSGDYAGKLETVRGIVNEDPERAAQVVKHWVGQNE